MGYSGRTSFQFEASLNLLMKNCHRIAILAWCWRSISKPWKCCVVAISCKEVSVGGIGTLRMLSMNQCRPPIHEWECVLLKKLESLCLRRIKLILMKQRGHYWM